jgi:hypothetical protein
VTDELPSDSDVLRAIAQVYADLTDSDGWDIEIMERVWELLVASGYAEDDDA